MPAWRGRAGGYPGGTRSADPARHGAPRSVRLASRRVFRGSRQEGPSVRSASHLVQSPGGLPRYWTAGPSPSPRAPDSRSPFQMARRIRGRSGRRVQEEPLSGDPSAAGKLADNPGLMISVALPVDRSTSQTFQESSCWMDQPSAVQVVTSDRYCRAWSESGENSAKRMKVPGSSAGSSRTGFEENRFRIPAGENVASVGWFQSASQWERTPAGGSARVVPGTPMNRRTPRSTGTDPGHPWICLIRPPGPGRPGQVPRRRHPIRPARRPPSSVRAGGG